MYSLLLLTFLHLCLSIDCKIDYDYCTIDEKHVLCEKETKFDEKCQKTTKTIKIKEHERESILENINYWRNIIATGKRISKNQDATQQQIANMMEMKWDNELEKTATILSNKCSSYRPCETCLDLERFPSTYVQEIDNVFDDRILESSPESRIYFTPYLSNLFFKKDHNHAKHTPTGNHRSLNDNTTSYDKMSWAEIYLVGCSISIHKKEKNFAYNFVCTFGPVAPSSKEDASRYGLQCSECPIGAKCSSKKEALCHCDGICYPMEYKISRIRRADNKTAEVTTKSKDKAGGATEETTIAVTEAGGEGSGEGGGGGGGGQEPTIPAGGDPGPTVPVIPGGGGVPGDLTTSAPSSDTSTEASESGVDKIKGAEFFVQIIYIIFVTCVLGQNAN